MVDQTERFGSVSKKKKLKTATEKEKIHQKGG